MKKNLLLLLFALFCASHLYARPEDKIDLSGIWRFQLDPMGFGKTPGSELYLAKLAETITLPGSTDEGGKGIRTTARYVDRLTRKFEYCGPAWYQREIDIPAGWKDKEIVLELERCHWETTLYIDGKYIAIDERLSTPNRFVLTPHLTPGVHTLTLCVDNRLKYPMDQWNHGTTEYTQTNWNGIIGKMELTAKNPSYIQRIKAYPDVKNRKVKIDLQLHTAAGDSIGEIRYTLRDPKGKIVHTSTVAANLKAQTLSQDLPVGKNMMLWDEFTPNLYELETTVKAGQTQETHTLRFGMRHVEQGKNHIRLNGRNIHLRGTLDCAVFPLTGYPSTRVEDWKRIFDTVKDYGMNHIRFHSWCPPEAAFTAADEVGIYLQAELPMWIKDVGQYPARRDFFEKEMYAILDEYGNHPSFILMCNGNENGGNFDVLEDLVKKAQAYDNRRLYSASTARTHTPSDQYYVSHVTSKGGITVYEGIPSTQWDKRKESDIDVPVIAHESGQRCMYPNFDEIKKYTGVLEARNFEVFRERLAKNGMLQQADDFFKATGEHTVLQYKEVNESLLRTPNSGGFQLLGLSDFPGQGSAFVGILDAFWESKGLVAPEKFRESCAPTVLLARFPKRVYTDDEKFQAQVDIYHYGASPVKRNTLRWQLENAEGQILKKGTIATPAIPCAVVDTLGNLDIPLQFVTRPEKLTLKVSLENYRNEWNIWVYPRQADTPQEAYVLVSHWDAPAKALLEQGKNVLLVPRQAPGRKTHFAGHFWNPIMFNWNPMIVGTWIQASHPAFRDFPTGTYADWQWWDILNYATAMELNDLKNITPVIQSIDTYEENRKLGIAFEARVGKGNLFVLCVDPDKDLEKRQATRQLLHSVRNYVASPEFHPANELQYHELDALFTAKPREATGNNSEAIKQLLNQ